jgi:predicted N-acetyltransferase YhbS
MKQRRGYVCAYECPNRFEERFRIVGDRKSGVNESESSQIPGMIHYESGNQLDVDAVIELYDASTLGERRPIQDRDRMHRMLKNANLVITAWEEESLVGIARSISDFAYCTYLSDLAVRKSHQSKGIGKELIRRTQIEAPQATVILLAAPKAAAYYPHVGMERHDSAWILRAGRTLG